MPLRQVARSSEMDDWELWLSSAGKINATFAIHDEDGARSFSGLKMVN